MPEQTAINVSVEMEPHTTDTTGMILNRPAPQTGAFLIHQRIDEPIWREMKTASAWYWSEDDLEDFDMFQSTPGWRYSLAALQVLISHGYALQIRDQLVTTADQLTAMFTDEAKAAYRQRLADERERIEQQQRQEQQRQEQEAARQLAEYDAWKAEHLAGLVPSFSIAPWHYNFQYHTQITWQQIAYFPKDVPGTWYTTGDDWYSAQVDGQTIYRRLYGNASICYAPQATVDAWVEAEYRWHVGHTGEVKAARHILEHAGRGCIGDDVADRLIELHGVERFIQIATREPWTVSRKTWDNPISRKLDDACKAAEKHGITLTVID